MIHSNRTSCLFILFLLIGFIFPFEFRADLNINKQKPMIIFMRSYINYAWDFTHSGWFITNNADLYYFDFSDNSNLSSLFREDIIKRISMDSIFTYSNLSDTAISLAETSSMFELLKEEDLSIYSERQFTCADFGGWSYFICIPNTDSTSFNKHLLLTVGNLAYKNESEKAISVALWLSRFDGGVENLHCNPFDFSLRVEPSLLPNSILNTSNRSNKKTYDVSGRKMFSHKKETDKMILFIGK